MIGAAVAVRHGVPPRRHAGRLRAAEAERPGTRKRDIRAASPSADQSLVRGRAGALRIARWDLPEKSPPTVGGCAKCCYTGRSEDQLRVRGLGVATMVTLVWVSVTSAAIEVRCHDGSRVARVRQRNLHAHYRLCDLDGACDGVCTFSISSVCLACYLNTQLTPSDF